MRLCECGCKRPIPRGRYVTFSAACYVRWARKPVADERGRANGKRGGRPRQKVTSA